MHGGILAFQEIVWGYYATHGRHDLPWRQANMPGEFDAYAILVSEIMLQQTQVGRVISKYQVFMQHFPTVQSLAYAELGDVLRVWQGLGYNRRAKYLWQAAQMIVRDHDGVVPRAMGELITLPGVGANTAGAICAYTYDEPVVFIETNIRTVMIYHYFSGKSGILESDIQRMVRDTLPTQKSPRQWYWALMDYGANLKQTKGNFNKLSKTYVKQSTFHGSKRQIRGRILHMLSKHSMTIQELHFALPDARLDLVLHDLVSEQLVCKTGASYHL